MISRFHPASDFCVLPVILAAAALQTAVCLFATRAPPPDAPLSIWFCQPASSFLESLPVGNGRLGGMLFGGVGQERVVLNEQTLWSGSVQDADREDAHVVLPEIRRLLFEGKNREAQALLARNFICKGPGASQGQGAEAPYGSYQTLGDLLLDFGDGTNDVSGYRRDLDLDSAIACVSFERDGVTFARELFATEPDEALVLRLTASKLGALSFTARLNRQKCVGYRFRGKDEIEMFGQLPSGQANVAGMRYLARLKIVANGGNLAPAAKAEDGIAVKGANAVTLFVTAGTDYVDKKFEQTPARQLAAVAKWPFAKVREDHLREFRSFFRRVALELPATDAAQLPTPERVKLAETRPDPQLAALYFQFGRYLLINSSRPGLAAAREPAGPLGGGLPGAVER